MHARVSVFVCVYIDAYTQDAPVLTHLQTHMYIRSTTHIHTHAYTKGDY